MEESQDVSRRDVVKIAGAAAVAAAAPKLQSGPLIQTVHAAGDTVNFAVIGTGGRGSYLLKHFNGTDGGRCAAVCDIDDTALKNGITTSKDKPQGYKDYREILARKDIDAVVVTVPLYMHFPITKDALEAGKHVFCEKSLVFKPEEVHQLRELVKAHPNQVLQTGLQRRYSRFYRTAKQMIDKGMLGEVTHVRAQWHRKSLGKTWLPPSWRVYRKYSGGLTAELASHQIDIATWMFGAEPEFVVGVGGIDVYKDGRDTYDNIELIYSYPRGRKLMYSSISNNNHLPLFNGERNEFGEIIMGSEGTIHITVGSDNEPALAIWFPEPQPDKVKPAEPGKEKPAVAGATLEGTGKGRRGLPILFDEEKITGNESFLGKEMKFAKMWLYSKGVMVPEERNPVDNELMDFFECVRTGRHPVADIEVGLADSTAVILSNLAMDEGRRVYMKEMETMGLGKTPEKAPASSTNETRKT